jgi:hypothetical protein
MGLKLYCNRYGHFKDPLVCSVVCPYRTRCRDFAIHYDENRAEVDALVANYYASRTPANAPVASSEHKVNIAVPVEMRALIKLEVKRIMSDTTYIWIGKEGIAELVEHDEVIRRAEKGNKAKAIYKVAQEMELRFQLVPRKRIEKAKKLAAVDADRAAARRRGPRAVEPEPLPAPTLAVQPEALPAARRTRSRRIAG